MPAFTTPNFEINFGELMARLEQTERRIGAAREKESLALQEKRLKEQIIGLALKSRYRSTSHSEAKLLELVKKQDDLQFFVTGRLPNTPAPSFPPLTLGNLDLYKLPEGEKENILRAEEEFAKQNEPAKIDRMITSYFRSEKKLLNESYEAAKLERERLEAKVEEILMTAHLESEKHQVHYVTRVTQAQAHVQMTSEELVEYLNAEKHAPQRELVITRVVNINQADDDAGAAPARPDETPSKKRGRPKVYTVSERRRKVSRNKTDAEEGWCTGCPREDGIKPVSSALYAVPACADCAKTFSQLAARAKESPGCSLAYCTERRRCNWCVYQEWIAKGFKEKVPPAA
ncbi:unnamed protein product, partial [Mesorhabditis spiculigera]